MDATRLTALVELYRKQLGRFQQTLALAQEQYECAEKGDFPELHEVLERRDRLAAEITEASADVAQMCQSLQVELAVPEINLTNLSTRVPNEVLQPLAAVLGDLTDVIEQIQAQDDETARVLKRMVEGVRGQMSEVQRGQEALQAYKPKNQGAARYLDKQK